jgi:hypothetical protein
VDCDFDQTYGTRATSRSIAGGLPPDDSVVTDAMWLDAARRHFGGTVIVGKDLLEI